MNEADLTRDILNRIALKLNEDYQNVKLGNSSFENGKIWVSLIVPKNLLDDENFDNYLAELSTDLLMEKKKLVIFQTNLEPEKLTIF